MLKFATYDVTALNGSKYVKKTNSYSRCSNLRRI